MGSSELQNSITGLQDQSVSDCSEPSQRATVLLVDDDGMVLRGIERSFQGSGIRLLSAISAAEARVYVTRHAVDLILSDNLMPGEFGSDFLAEVRHQYPQIKLMMLSGYMPQAAAERVRRELGVINVLMKPCPASAVVKAVKDALDLS
ncbi:MAG: hypothetical protein Fues2KO_04610 [Fuerstiella sp.]